MRARSLSAFVNLVPYIDLMTTIITFLMMTAIWTQMGSIDVQSQAAASAAPENELKVKPVLVMITAQGLMVGEEDAKPQTLLKTTNGEYDLPALKNALLQLKSSHPERLELGLFAADGTKYQQIVQVMDVATGIGLSQISLQPLATS